MQLSIRQDIDPMDPRDDDNLGTMACFHKRYNLGDKDHGYKSEDYSGWDAMEKAVRKEEGARVCVPVYGYDHGGLTISTTPFSCPYDSGQLGFIFVSDKRIRKEFTCKRITDALLDRARVRLRNEVETYNQYLTGDVWYYAIEDDAGEVVDSCHGFFGHEHCEEEAQRQLEYFQEQADEAMRAHVPEMAPAPVCCTI